MDGDIYLRINLRSESSKISVSPLTIRPHIMYVSLVIVPAKKSCKNVPATYAYGHVRKYTDRHVYDYVDTIYSIMAPEKWRLAASSGVPRSSHNLGTLCKVR